MASITVRNLETDLKERLRRRAADHGRSMEDEVREILRTTLADDQSALHPAEAIRRLFAPLGGVDLEIPKRQPMREPPDFSR
ncbi:plasmid stabilization protein [Endothiovibrio diazotrophicus]